MIKELKYFFFTLVIFLFFFYIFKYYFSNTNIKNSYRSLKKNNFKIEAFSQNLLLLTNDTNNVAEYVEKSIDKNKKNYNFWKLINNND